jgi:outer membrane immunogenic protein
MTQVRSFRLVALSTCSAVALLAIGGTQAEAQGAPVPTWAGFYIGATIGYGEGSTRWIDARNPNIAWTNNGNGGAANINADGLAYGFLGGYNFQSGRVVVGIETDITRIDGKGTFNWNLPTTSNSSPTAVINTKLNWVGTTRARIGYAFDSLLVYVTGGIAYGDAQAHWTQSATSGAQWDVSNTMRAGTVLGGGVEYMITNNWSLRAEALHVTFNRTQAVDVTPASAPDFGGTSGYSMSTRTHETIARVGATFKF